MKAGQLVYIPKMDSYGFVHEISPDGRIKYVMRIDGQTGGFDIVDVYDLIVDTVDLITRFIVLFKMIFKKKK